jgi:hypothetical protein
MNRILLLAIIVINLMILAVCVVTQINVHSLLKGAKKIMAQEDELAAAVKAAADEEATLETRVDGLIAALQAPHDSPVVAQAIADLQALKSRESNYQGGSAVAQS